MAATSFETSTTRSKTAYHPGASCYVMRRNAALSETTRKPQLPVSHPQRKVTQTGCSKRVEVGGLTHSPHAAALKIRSTGSGEGLDQRGRPSVNDI
jgi:hypothetical protein